MTIIKHLIDAAKGKHPLSAKRSSHWAATRRQHLELHPACAMCGGTEKLDVHHIRPFHLHPELELEPSNLITLCEAGHGGANCHLLFGHLGNFRSFNVDVAADAARWNDKITHRPLAETEAS
ncbi:HNH endonuclease [Burkholderia cepacia]|uniref:HNH endonuclease n=1 Tax=Burkholderia cepacia TaxID=292 RepID=UPI001F1DE3EB|nr:HNH endonuclease signature motif containing protein [Burkholderia cepacia]MCE4125742.1 HNH endonuclease [Burkholderia cepacia]